jgi:hypothetical protein
MRCTTTQVMTVGVVSVDEEYFRALLKLYLPLPGIAINWYLFAQLPWTNLLAFLILFYPLMFALLCCEGSMQLSSCISSSISVLPYSGRLAGCSSPKMHRSPINIELWAL